MGKVAFVFSGQGAQYSGMGKSLYEASPAAKAVFDTAEQIRPGTIAQCFESPVEELSVTKNTQPCLFCVDLAAAEALREAGVAADGGKAVPLKVSGGFHSPFMESASIRLAEVLGGMDVKAPQVPVYANYTAEPYTVQTAKELLVKQVSNPVRWQQTVEKLLEDGVDTFIEVGAGKTLCGLIKRMSRTAKIYNVEDAASLAAAVAAVREENA